MLLKLSICVLHRPNYSNLKTYERCQQPFKTTTSRNLNRFLPFATSLWNLINSWKRRMISKDWATNDTHRKIKMRSIDLKSRLFRVSYVIAEEWTSPWSPHLTKLMLVQEEDLNKAHSLEHRIEVIQKARFPTVLLASRMDQPEKKVS